MKKFFGFMLILFITCFMGILDVNAASSKITNKSFEWEDIKNFSECKLKCSVPITGGDITSGNILKSAKGGVTFKSTNNVKCSIYRVKELTGNDVDELITEQSLTPPTSPKTPVETSSSNQEQTTTISTKSNNANLKTLQIKTNNEEEVKLSPSFNPDTYEYNATVQASVKTVIINAIMQDAKANLVISNNASEELIAGENNKLTVTVTAEDGTKKAYVINVKREALTADATLKSLSIEEYPNFKLKSDKFKYKVKVKKSVKKLTIYYELNDNNSSVIITGNNNLKNGSKVKILVTAQDGTKKEYVLTISKNDFVTKSKAKSINVEKNPLIIMALSMIAFGLIGGIVYVIKK